MNNSTFDHGDIIETINILLIGNKDEIAEAIKLIDHHFRDKIVKIIRNRALSANYDDWFDIYQEVLLNIYESAQNRKYDPDSKKLEGFIYKIANARAIDWIKKREAKKRKSDNDVLIDSVAEIIKDSNIHDSWVYAQQNEQRNIILEGIRNSVPRLKIRQRQVAEIIIENFPTPLSDSDIKEQLLKKYNEDVTTATVKSAKRELLKKVEARLIRNGCGDFVNG